jgi:hypothetical protein
MPEIVYATETTPKDEPVVGSALKQGPGLPLVKRKRKKKQVKHSNTRDLFLKLTLI